MKCLQRIESIKNRSIRPPAHCWQTNGNQTVRCGLMHVLHHAAGRVWDINKRRTSTVCLSYYITASQTTFPFYDNLPWYFETSDLHQHLRGRYLHVWDLFGRYLQNLVQHLSQGEISGIHKFHSFTTLWLKKLFVIFSFTPFYIILIVTSQFCCVPFPKIILSNLL